MGTAALEVSCVVTTIPTEIVTKTSGCPIHETALAKRAAGFTGNLVTLGSWALGLKVLIDLLLNVVFTEVAPQARRVRLLHQIRRDNRRLRTTR